MEPVYINYFLTVGALLAILAAVLFPRKDKRGLTHEERISAEVSEYLKPYATPLNYAIFFIVFVCVGIYLVLLEGKTFLGLEANSKSFLSIAILGGFAVAAVLIKLMNNKRAIAAGAPAKSQKRDDLKKEAANYLNAQIKHLPGLRLRLLMTVLSAGACVALAGYRDIYMALLFFLAALAFGAVYSIRIPWNYTGKLSGYITLAIVFMAGGLWFCASVPPVGFVLLMGSIACSAREIASKS